MSHASDHFASNDRAPSSHPAFDVSAQPEAVFRLFDEIQHEVASGRFADDPALARTFEAFAVTLEELKVAEENLLSVNHNLTSTRLQLDAERLRYHHLFDLAPDGFLVTDANGAILETNRAASTLFNVPQRFIIGKVVPSFVPESDRREFRSWLRDAAKRPTSPPLWRFRLLPRNGLPTPVEVALRLAPPSQGRRGELLWLLRRLSEREPYAPQWPEIPDRDGLLAQAYADRERYRLLLDASSVVIYEADPADGRITFVGKQGESLLGYTPSEWTASPGFLDARIHPDDRPTIEALRARQLQSGEDVEVEYRVFTASGRVVWLRENCRFTTEPTPRLHGALINISRRKRIERRLYFTRTEAETEARELAHLLHLTQQLLAARDLPAILDEILSAVAALLGSDMGSLALLDGPSPSLRLAASRGLPDDQTLPAPFPESASQRALNERRITLVNDFEAPDQSPSEQSRARLGGFRAEVSLPLLDRDAHPLGVAAIHFPDPHTPSPRHLELVTLYAHHAGPYLHDALRRQSP